VSSIHGGYLKTRRPEKGQFEEYLESHSVPLGEISDEGNYETAVLAEDFLVTRGNAVWFDAETGMFPNEHHKLMHLLTARSQLQKAVFTEIAPPANADRDVKYRLKAEINGKSYDTEAKNMGDWYDYAMVVRFLNEIASDQGTDELYVMLYTGDQTVKVWITEPIAFNQLLDDGLLSLSQENEALEAGLSFEESMKKKLKERK